MKLEDIAIPQQATPAHTPARYSPPEVRSSHPDVQELIARFNAHQEIDCPSLDGGELALIGAIYLEVVDDPDFSPTSHILQLIQTMNAKMHQAVGDPA